MDPEKTTGMSRITESDSGYRNLENLEIAEILQGINREDHTVAAAVERSIPQIEALAHCYYETIRSNGRVFYIGAGTSGRLGIVDASELPPTYGLEHGRVTGLIAGGDSAIRKAVEFAEDSTDAAWLDLQNAGIQKGDLVIGIAASGTTPYVIHGLRQSRAAGMHTGCITCNPDAPLCAEADFPVVVVTGPEFITGSTRMKAGTAQKLVLNMLSTAAMVKLGRVKDNKMVDMTPTNHKLIERGIKMIMEEIPVNAETAEFLLKTHGSVRKAVEAWSRENP